jgi:hypothetical protein
MKSKVVLPLRNLASVQLGRFVLDLKEPQSDYFETSEPLVQTLPPFDSKAFDEDDESEKSLRFFGYLSKALNVSHSSNKNVSFDIKSSRCRTYQMDNSGGWFREACKVETTKQWLDEQIEASRDVFLIVGLQTMLNAKVNRKDDADRETKASAEAPIDRIATHGASAVVGNAASAVNVGGGANVDKKANQHVSLIGAGEQLYAIQYRKVKVNFHSSKEAGNKEKLLLQNCWLRFKDVRGDDDDGTDDIVEADIDDDLELEDEWQQYACGEENDEPVVYLFELSDENALEL